MDLSQLDKYLKNNGISPEKVGPDIGLAEGTIRNWFNKKKPTRPRLDRLIKLCDHLKISIDFACGRTPNPRSHLPPSEQIPDLRKIKSFLLEIVEIHKGTDPIFMKMIEELNNVDGSSSNCCGKCTDKKRRFKKKD